MRVPTVLKTLAVDGGYVLVKGAPERWVLDTALHPALSQGAEYDVALAAVNRVGAGPRRWGATVGGVVRIPLAPPGPPTGVRCAGFTAAGHARLVWRAPRAGVVDRYVGGGGVVRQEP